MTDDSLFNELKKLSKRANQRIVRLERLTETKESFAVKQLADYLSAGQVQGWSAKGRVRASKKMTETQMIATIKATKMFLEDSTSRVSEVKKIKKEYEEKAGKPLNYAQTNTYYQAKKNYTWIYEYIGKSEFWSDLVPLAKRESWDKEQWIDILSGMISKEIDEQLKIDLEALYDYAMQE